GCRHRTDLVAAFGAGDFIGYVAAGKPRHGGGEVDDRLADAAANHRDQHGAGCRYRNENRECDQEAEARGGIGKPENVFGVVVEGIAYLDDGPEAELGFHEVLIDVVGEFAGGRAFLGELQFIAETLDVGLVHLVQRRGDVGGRGGIAAQFLQRHQDLVGSALRAAVFHLFSIGGDAVVADEVLVNAGVVAADVAQGPCDVGVDGLPVGVAVELRHAPHLFVEQRRDCDIEGRVVGDNLSGRVLAGFGRAVDGLVYGL